MEVIIYDLQEGFLPYVEKNPQFLDQLHELSCAQQERILHPMDEEVLKERAVQYFNNDAIYVKEHVLHYENTLRGITYRMRIDAHQITVFEQEQNPFLPFLKRIFRRFFSCPSQETQGTI